MRLCGEERKEQSRKNAEKIERKERSHLSFCPFSSAIFYLALSSHLRKDASLISHRSIADAAFRLVLLAEDQFHVALSHFLRGLPVLESFSSAGISPIFRYYNVTLGPSSPNGKQI